MNTQKIKKLSKRVTVGLLVLTLTLTSTSVASADRGHCTDSHSKDWCDANGYENNRPVAGTVKLTEKQKKAYWKLVSRGVLTTIGVIVTQDYVLVPFYMLDAIDSFSDF